MFILLLDFEFLIVDKVVLGVIFEPVVEIKRAWFILVSQAVNHNSQNLQTWKRGRIKRGKKGVGHDHSTQFNLLQISFFLALMFILWFNRRMISFLTNSVSGLVLMMIQLKINNHLFGCWENPVKRAEPKFHYSIVMLN